MMTLIRELGRRIRMSTAYGVTTGAIRIGPDGLPVVQVRLATMETMDLRVVEQRGFASDLPIGTPVHAHFAAGDRSNGVINGSTSPSDRPPTAGTDDRVIFAHGYWLTLAADGIHINSSCPKVFIDGCDLAVTGAITATKEITAFAGSGASVTLSKHKHPTAQVGAPSMPEPGT